ncbi:MAG: hypothetical protein KKF52_05450 [Nanoarchaeota archaeon]|nr:hypothetical protein [Nanoarchaeota archaeon]MBU4352599.1 hypothetical protein [Nanoarchaeota archaeon]MCG2720104.1 hypothetical protein [Nanoarchaeota archaeon]
MASVTFAIPADIKAEMKSLAWVNWSESAREKLLTDIERSKALEKLIKIVSKSKFTEKDAGLLSEKVKSSMHKQLKKEGLI